MSSCSPSQRSCHAGPLLAQVAAEAPAPAPGQVATTETADFSDAEVRRVDKDAQKITLRHGPDSESRHGGHDHGLPRCRAALARRVEGWQQDRFTADKVGGLYTITNVEVVN